MSAHLVLDALRARKRGHTLPGAFYTDPDIYATDLAAIWYRDWMFAGHTCEVATAGAFFTLQIGDYPIVVVRGRDGAVRAFHNACRHRGSRVCVTERGRATRLVCPYHSWTYDLDGRLIGARDMGPDFERADYGLKPVHCESVGGYVFVCVAEAAPAFAPFRAAMEPYFLPHGLEDTKVAVSTTIVEEGNWKLVFENNRECYHCSRNHPELLRTFPELPTLTGVEGAMSEPMIAEMWERLEGQGLPSRFALSADGQFRTSRVPLIDDAVSFTLSGAAAVARPLARGLPDHIGSLLLFHYPSTWNHVLEDHAVTFRLTPIGPRRTQLTTKWLVHKDAVEGVDYDVDTLTAVWNATNDQDRRIVEENQIGVASPAYEPGPYSPGHEGGVIQFVEWYAGAMERALGEGARLRSVA